jgi:hypothetical protein
MAHMTEQVSDLVHEREQECVFVQVVVDRDLVIATIDRRKIIAEPRQAAAFDLQLKIVIDYPLRN